MDNINGSSDNKHLRGNVFCQICDVLLTRESPAGRQAHYEQHFDDLPEVPQAGPSNVMDFSEDKHSNIASTKPGLSGQEKEKATLPSPDKQNIFWIQSQDTPPPKNFTPVLKQALLKSHARGQTVRAAFCYEGMVHVATEMWDMGWGCGYRNFLMACTALIDQQVQPMYFSVLDQPIPPGVRNLQRWIEDAWKAGFDEEGASDLNSKLINTRKWIGTAELYVAFLSRGIPSRLVDFPRVASSADAVLQWVERYFTSPFQHNAQAMRARVKATVDEALRGASPVVVTDRMPLVLQHAGHSRTIVGYERLKNGTINLLCFDPSRRPSSQIREAAIAHYSRTRTHPTSTTPSQKRKRGISPFKILSHVLSSRNHRNSLSSSPTSDNNKKRRSKEEDDLHDTKRVRGDLRVSDADKDVIIIQDDDDSAVDDAPPSSSIHKHLDKFDYMKALEFFRLKPKKVGRNDRYQILYFPLEDLLSEQERWERRVVTSEVIQ
ncbi:hypothetical protein EW145_g1427 [Phellinidium pouzarii]|uniref:UFSP1/2/DUB catalytic domain-containing protein n=1 Tax=Phellinidium pouzarii TaxID=167371 RepID=A0A4S4LEI5_9AGAM|nr:hypothetical protein EW145_g1427 [Phellinidium pouzarii]